MARKRKDSTETGADAAMDADLEDLDRYRAEADAINLNRYRNRRRAIYAVFLGAFMAFLVWLGMEMWGSQKNPCERVHAYLCGKDPGGLQCQSYKDILRESENDPSAAMRSNIRAQCQRKIERLAEEDNVQVP